MTTKEHECQNNRVINNIQAIFNVHGQLRQYAAALQISIENATIVLRGEVPSVDVKAELVPAVRRAGVLSRVANCVNVAN